MRIVNWCRKRWYFVLAAVAFIIVIAVVVILAAGTGSRVKEAESVTVGANKGEKKKDTKKEKETSGTEITKEAATATPEPAPLPSATAVAVWTEPEFYPESEGTRKAYLTFDDGCSEQTDRILDILAQYGLKATFFVTKQEGEENAARYRRIVAEGHSIGLHSVSHNYKTVYANLESYISDVEGIRQFVLDTTGVDSHLYRFPGGSSNTVSQFPIEDCIRYLKQNGYRYYDWNIDTSDAVNHRMTAQELADRALSTAVDKYHNCVILMHDSASQGTTVEALPYIIDGLRARGMEILPITGNTPLVQHKKAATVQ